MKEKLYWLIWNLNNISTLVCAVISAVGGVWGIIAHFIKGKKLSQGIWLLFISIILMPIVIIGNEVVEVPLVEGTTCNEAYFMLSERGLVGTPIIVTGQVVVSQDPKAGELALKGDQVNLLFTESEPVSMIEDEGNIEQGKREWLAEDNIGQEQKEWLVEYELYSRERDNPYAQINAGYILANHLIDEADRDDEAIQFYERANCIEAERNLFALYLKREKIDLADEMAYKLLYIENDDVTWNYISNCLFDMSWDEYCLDNEQSKENFPFNVNEMMELEDTRQEYRGANPPSDRTEDSAWIPVGIDFEVTETTDHPYIIWHFYKRRFWKGITDYEMMYAP